MLGIIVVSALMAGSAIAAQTNWFLPGTWEADAALRFNPFTLQTLSPKTTTVKNTESGRASVPAEATGESTVSVDSVVAAVAPPPPLPAMSTYVPLPRIPYRPPLRSPYRPPL